MSEIVLVIDNVRSGHNVGAMLRTAEGLGLKRVVLCGITPHPRLSPDSRLPHVINAAERKIFKTSLGAEQNLQLSYFPHLKTALKQLSDDGFRLIGLELTPGAQDLHNYQPQAERLALVVGHERHGLASETINQLDEVVMIPMRGQNQSFNAAIAVAMALYQLTR